MTPAQQPAAPDPSTSDQQPVALLYGRGHRIVRGNAAFLALALIARCLMTIIGKLPEQSSDKKMQPLVH